MSFAFLIGYFDIALFSLPSSLSSIKKYRVHLVGCLGLCCLLFMKNSKPTVTNGQQRSASKVQERFSAPRFVLKIIRYFSFRGNNLFFFKESLF